MIWSSQWPSGQRSGITAPWQMRKLKFPRGSAVVPNLWQLPNWGPPCQSHSLISLGSSHPGTSSPTTLIASVLFSSDVPDRPSPGFAVTMALACSCPVSSPVAPSSLVWAQTHCLIREALPDYPTERARSCPSLPSSCVSFLQRAWHCIRW